jgi:hypothetical protein
MHIATIAFAVSLQVAAPPTEWLPLTGTEKIEYRWSRPASNSCLIEFRSSDSTGAEKFTTVATVVTNAVPKPKTVYRVGAPPVPPAIIKENKEDRTAAIEVGPSGTAVQSFDSCYRVVLVKGKDVSAHPSAAASSAGGASARGSSANASKEDTSTGHATKDSKSKPEQ